MTNKDSLIARRARALLQKIDGIVTDYEANKEAWKAGNGPRPMREPTLGEMAQELRALKKALEGETSPESIPHTVSREPAMGRGVKETDMLERHESFGIVSISRQFGGSFRLFGSQVQKHSVTYELEIHRAQRIHSNLHYDRFRKDTSKDRGYGETHIVSIRLSAAQLTDMITNMNNGEGVPCTLDSVSGIRMECVPEEHVNEREQIANDFKAKMADLRAATKSYTDDIAKILGKTGTIGKGDRKELASLIERLVRQSTDNVGFTIDQFGEAVDKMETHARAEVESYANSVIHAAGIANLQRIAAEQGKTLIEVEGGEKPPLRVGQAPLNDPQFRPGEKDEE